ncbi:hypothetical protein [Streptomyces sp. NPDC059349]|uniref:hypothetical protein n=1 Tax=Streptomyces sp. NPDC059349 TaxID=3346808 RepID=UPI00367F013A
MDGSAGRRGGFQYQYLRTLEHLVAAIDEPEVACVRVEGPPAGDGPVDKVDFGVVDADGSVRTTVQVKSRVAGGSMSGAMALGVLLGMLNTSQEVRSYCLLINARPGVKGDRLDEVLSADVEPQVLRASLMELFHDAPQRRDELQRLDAGGLARVARCRLEFDARDGDEICSLRRGLRRCPTW